MACINYICRPSTWFLSHILPMQSSPIISFLLLVGLFFLVTDFILTVFSVLAVYVGLSHILIALTMISWASSPIELINLMVSAKKGELQMGLTSILSGLVFAFYGLIPLAMLGKMAKRGVHEIEILQPIHSSSVLMLPALLVTGFTMVIYYKTGMRLGKGSCAALIAAYGGYISYMAWELAGEKG